MALVFEVGMSTVKNWRRIAESEMLDNKSDTPLIAIFTAGIKAAYELLLLPSHYG